MEVVVVVVVDKNLGRGVFFIPLEYLLTDDIDFVRFILDNLYNFEKVGGCSGLGTQVVIIHLHIL